MPVKPIGQSMIEANLINQYQLDELLEYQKNSEQRVPLGRLTVELGLVKDEEFAPFLASYFNVPYMNLEDCSLVQPEAISLVPQPIAKRLNILPLLKEDNMLTIAMSDPLDLPVVEDLEAVTGYRIKRVVSPANRIRESIKSCYSGVFLRSASADIKEKSTTASGQRHKYNWPLAPSLIRLLVERAYKNNAPAVHIQPHANRVEIFFRADRKLEKIASYPKIALSSISDYVKTTARLDASKSDLPQSGYFIFSNNDKLNIEVGVSILPTLSGERIVLEVPRRIGWMDEEAWYKSA